MPTNKKELTNEASEKEILDIRFSHDKELHKLKMEELTFVRETERIKHEHEMTRQRIKSAEIRKTQDRRNFGKYVG